MQNDYKAFFSHATGNAHPYAFQQRLAEEPCISRLISVPTGLGKTAAVVLAWLWNRQKNAASALAESSPSNPWPRRLVYCLPMRTLVEQTAGEAEKWLKAHGSFWDGNPATRRGKVGLHVLMGGEDATDWDLYPEEDAILIGTQDMLLSRALNRGYGMSRYRWPMHFGLLNNDCLWVLDETQLMGPGLSTACQLEALRNFPPQGFGSFGAAGSVTWYMSATNNPEHLKTREWRGVARSEEFEFGLSPEEKAATTGPIHRRRFAVKQLEIKQAASFEDAASAKPVIAELLKQHEEMLAAIANESSLPARTIIICNTVDRAVTVHALLASEKPMACDLLLLHSRFRPPERREQMKRLGSLDRATFPKGQIVVATQVIEAGVDVSSGILCSEVAPLASLVQRLGRLNRAGEFNQSPWNPTAIIVGVGVEAAPLRENKEAREKRQKDNAKRCLPYELLACENALKSLGKLHNNASPANLDTVHADIAASIPRCPYSLQRHELTDFFDTDANLSLGFTDVSPFVRGLDEDTDLQVCWREAWTEDGGPPDFSPDYQRDELCTVPIDKAKDPKAREVLNRGWLWRGKESGWISVRDAGLAPGMTILLPLSAGGYDNAAGWTGDKADQNHGAHYEQKDGPTDEEQLSNLSNGWQSIAVHTTAVADELRELLPHLLSVTENVDERDALMKAVPWHDVGKNHPGWQQAVLKALEKAGITGRDEHKPFAKFSLSESPSLLENGQRLVGPALKRKIRELRNSFRPGIAHEVASALAFRQAEQARLGQSRDTNLASLLAEYVIMSHHGRVRKVLRDEIPRFPDSDPDTNTVRGVADRSTISPIEIDGNNLGCDSLSTDCRRMGRDAHGHESYTRGVLRLLERYGPFRLAFFEAIFRAADIRASIAASGKSNA